MNLTAPDLLIYEVTNALRYNPDLAPTDLERAVQALYKIHIAMHAPSEEVMVKSIANALKNQITIYDAAYLSHAEAGDSTFITADEKLYSKIKENPKVALLSSEKVRALLS